MWEGDDREQDIWKDHRLSRHEFEKATGDGEGQGSLVCCSPWGHKESGTTEWLNKQYGNNHLSKSLLYSRCQIEI